MVQPDNNEGNLVMLSVGPYGKILLIKKNRIAKQVRSAEENGWWWVCGQGEIVGNFLSLVIPSWATRQYGDGDFPQCKLSVIAHYFRVFL